MQRIISKKNIKKSDLRLHIDIIKLSKSFLNTTKNNIKIFLIRQRKLLSKEAKGLNKIL